MSSPLASSLTRDGWDGKGQRMQTPVTKLDQRFSDASAAATSWDDTRKAIEAAELFWLSTVRADGRPHITPVVAAWADDALWFSTGGEEQKSVNLRGNHQVALTTGCNGWEGGLDVVLEGEAVQVMDDDALRRAAAAFAAKWRGAWQWTVRDGHFYSGGEGAPPVDVYAVTPVRVFAYAKGPFGATTHRFG
jgi:nitroimidazol reductase NimA-like FMN-containing flavoprotein (pyridoxamine 5'-phosphate oxidase superfamily)